MEEGVALAAEKLFYIGPLPITNSLITTWLVTAILIGFAFVATRKVAAVPSGLQNFAEFCIESLYNLVESMAHQKTKVFFPIIASFFFFIIVGNYLGLMPGVGTIGFFEKPEETHLEETAVPQISTTSPAATEIDQDHEQETAPLPSNEHQDEAQALAQSENSKKESQQTAEGAKAGGHAVFVPLFRSINSDINTTLALALVSVIATHYLAIRYLGIFGYLQKWFSLNPIMLFVGVIELAGEFTKIVSLSFRLFGNIYAGESVLHTASTKLFAFFVPLPFLSLELIVGFVQALVFSMLTLAFMVLLTEKHAEH